MLCFSVLAFAMLTPLNNALNAPGAYFYDNFSDNLMKSDLVYTRAYGLDGPWVRYLGPDMEFSGREGFRNSAEVEVFTESGEIVPAQEFGVYDSNFCIQRYGYALVSLLPLSPRGLYMLLAAINVLLLAATLTGILVWLRMQSDTFTMLAVLFVVAFLSPIFTNFAPHLYWVPYTWFLPMLGMAWAVECKGREMEGRRRYTLLFWVALATCLFRQAHAFEYISGVMIAMLLPVLCRLLREAPLRQWRAWVKELLWPAAGALASFVLAMGGKVIAVLLTLAPGSAPGLAWAAVLENILKSTGGAETEAHFAAQGYDVSLGGILRKMLEEGAIVLRSRFSLSFGMVIVLLAIGTAIALLYRADEKRRKKNISLFILAWISLFAPMFWFVAGRLHVVDHIKIDLVVWYLPFMPLACAALASLAGVPASLLWGRLSAKKTGTKH